MEWDKELQFVVLGTKHVVLWYDLLCMGAESGDETTGGRQVYVVGTKIMIINY
jgi:hypothetical protein